MTLLKPNPITTYETTNIYEAAYCIMGKDNNVRLEQIEHNRGTTVHYHLKGSDLEHRMKNFRRKNITVNLNDYLEVICFLETKREKVLQGGK